MVVSPTYMKHGVGTQRQCMLTFVYRLNLQSPLCHPPYVTLTPHVTLPYIVLDVDIVCGLEQGGNYVAGFATCPQCVHQDRVTSLQNTRGYSVVVTA